MSAFFRVSVRIGRYFYLERADRPIQANGSGGGGVSAETSMNDFNSILSFYFRRASLSNAHIATGSASNNSQLVQRRHLKIKKYIDAFNHISVKSSLGTETLK